VDLEPCQSVADVGLRLVEGKRILNRLEQIVVDEQQRRYCEAKQSCPTCGRLDPGTTKNREGVKSQ
jgi:hypothetical protein